MLPTWQGHPVADSDLFWEHCGNAAMRRDNWKLVRSYPHAWELYDIDNDRTELHDLADQCPEVLDQLTTAWQAWADSIGLIPFETTIDFYRSKGITDPRATAMASAEDYL